MKRATSVYVIMLIVFGIGLWAIITTGSVFLRAPYDLAGIWELRPQQASDNSGKVRELNIDQSGRFFRASIDGQAHSLTLDSEQHDPRGQVQIKLAGTSLAVQFQSIPGSHEYLMSATGAIEGQWLAVRARTTAQRPTPPAATQHARP
jgi:hypothetical protein